MNQDQFLTKWEKGETRVLLDYTDIDCPDCGCCMVGCIQCVCGWKRDKEAGPAFAEGAVQSSGHSPRRPIRDIIAFLSFWASVISGAFFILSVQNISESWNLLSFNLFSVAILAFSYSFGCFCICGLHVGQEVIESEVKSQDV